MPEIKYLICPDIRDLENGFIDYELNLHLAKTGSYVRVDLERLKHIYREQQSELRSHKKAIKEIQAELDKLKQFWFR